MLSAIILAKNEQENLQQAIKSVSFAQEIIVIDDNSTDNTAKIATKLGAKVFINPLNDNFAVQRNFALSKATHEWVLFLDSDETISSELKKEILQNIQTTKFQGFLLKRLDTFMGKTLRYGETSNVRLLRLARKNAGNWRRPVHEVWRVQGPIKTLTNPIIHTPHTDISSFLKTINDYTTIEAVTRANRGEGFSFFEFLFFPPAKFFQNFILRLGFLDGFPGLIMAFTMSLHSAWVRIKLYEICKAKHI